MSKLEGDLRHLGYISNQKSKGQFDITRNSSVSQNRTHDSIHASQVLPPGPPDYTGNFLRTLADRIPDQNAKNAFINETNNLARTIAERELRFDENNLERYYKDLKRSNRKADKIKKVYGPEAAFHVHGQAHRIMEERQRSSTSELRSRPQQAPGPRPEQRPPYDGQALHGHRPPDHMVDYGQPGPSHRGQALFSKPVADSLNLARERGIPRAHHEHLQSPPEGITQQRLEQFPKEPAQESILPIQDQIRQYQREQEQSRRERMARDGYHPDGPGPMPTGAWLGASQVDMQRAQQELDRMNIHSGDPRYQRMLGDEYQKQRRDRLKQEERIKHLYQQKMRESSFLKAPTSDSKRYRSY